MQPATVRAEMPALEDGIAYFNTGASGLSPRRVVEAATGALEEQAYASDGYHTAATYYTATREAVARLLGVSPPSVALTTSTTDAINRIAGSIEWQPGDVVVRTDLEHPAGVLPWNRLARHRGVEVRVVETEGGRIDLEALQTAVDGARLVCVSALTWTHGTRLPVETITEIAHDAGAFVLVDAVQVPGQVPMDVTDWGADAVAAAGHKWLCGPFGAGFLYVRPDCETELVPQAIGYASVTNPDAGEGEAYTYQPGARRFEIGTMSPAPYAGLTEAIEILETVGLETVERRIKRLTKRLVDGIPPAQLLSPAEPESGLVTIEVPEPEATVARLEAAGIIVRSLPNPEAIRVSVHAFNTATEIDRLLTEL